MKPIAWLLLVGSTSGIIAAAANLAGLTGLPWIVPVLATAIVVLPAAISLALLVFLNDRPPEEKIVMILAGTFLRMGTALGGGILSFYWSAAIREHSLSFATWGIVLYLVTLAWETVLGLRLTNGAPEPKLTGPDL